MSDSLAQRLDRVERKPLKCGASRTQEVFVRGGEIFEQARQASQLNRSQAAADYGVSEGLLSRQVQNADNQHLSFQRMCEMPLKFQREVITAWAARLDGIAVKTVIEISEKLA